MRNIIILLLFISAEAGARLPDLIPYRKGELWGYCDSTKKIMIEPQFTDVSLFSNGRAIVQRTADQKMYLIDTTGKLVSRGYDYIDFETYHDRYIVFDFFLQWNDPWFALIDGRDSVIIPFFEGSLWWESDRHLKMYRGFGEKSRCGIVDRNGRKVVPFRYDGSKPLPPGTNGGHGLFIMRLRGKEKRSVLIDTTGRRVIPGSYETILYNDGVFVCTAGNTLSFFDLAGKPIPPPVRDSIPTPKYRTVLLAGLDVILVPDSSRTDVTAISAPFPNGARIVSLRTDKSGLVDSLYRFIVPPLHSSITRPDNMELALVTDKKMLNIAGSGVFVDDLVGYVDQYGTQYWED